MLHKKPSKTTAHVWDGFSFCVLTERKGDGTKEKSIIRPLQFFVVLHNSHWDCIENAYRELYQGQRRLRTEACTGRTKDKDVMSKVLVYGCSSEADGNGRKSLDLLRLKKTIFHRLKGSLQPSLWFGGFIYKGLTIWKITVKVQKSLLRQIQII